MYLGLLSKSEQKFFLEIARYSMGLNGEYKEVEEEILLAYKHECQLPDYKAYRQDDIEEIIATFNSSAKRTKKIVLIELLGIFLADGEVCVNELNFLYTLSKRFNINEDELKKIRHWVETINGVVKEGYELIAD